MTDYQRIDWSKLPELPGGRRVECSSKHEIELLCNQSTNARKYGNEPWAYYNDARDLIELDFKCTDIIGRFIVEQEAEQQKSKPRRVTPKELLVELIQTGDIWHVSPSREERVLGFRWNQNCGLQDHRANGEWGVTNIEWFGHFQFFDILEPPKPRLPVKTKAPEGCEWFRGGGGSLFLRSKDGLLTMAPPTSRLMAECYVAAGNAYLELNHAT